MTRTTKMKAKIKQTKKVSNKNINESTSSNSLETEKQIISGSTDQGKNDFTHKLDPDSRFNFGHIEKSSTSSSVDCKYLCTFCDLRFKSEDELQAHCRTQEHQIMIMSDVDQEWKFRPPPRGQCPSEYNLCHTVCQRVPIKCQLNMLCVKVRNLFLEKKCNESGIFEYVYGL